MRTVNFVSAAALVAAVLAASATQAAVITFDDLPGNYGPVPNGYAGLNWNNMYDLNALTYVPSGYQNGVVSPSNVAYNGYGAPASFTSAAPFTLGGFDMTAAWNNGLQVLVSGVRNGVVVDASVITVNTQGPQYFTFNWSDLNEVDFSSSGGTPAGYGGAGEHFALDNLALDFNGVPEPSTWAVSLVGLALLGATLRRRLQPASVKA